MLRIGGINTYRQDIAQSGFGDDLCGAAFSARILTVPDREENVGLTENDAACRQVRFRRTITGAIQFQDRAGGLGVVEQPVIFQTGGIRGEIIGVLIAGEGQRALQFVTECNCLARGVAVGTFGQGAHQTQDGLVALAIRRREARMFLCELL
ncbi:MAG TPA: hypothetical protein VN902_11740 [Candidatus Acidoferrales bacterium]|nr:hypothetical protein [Candidatus Acidoferrales bacterium]